MKLLKSIIALTMTVAIGATSFANVAATPIPEELNEISSESEMTAAEFFETDTVPVYLAVTNSANEKIIFDFLVHDMGLTAAAASGILANIYHESRFNPNAVGDNGTSYGICQWHNSRWDTMKTWCSTGGYDWTTVHGQLRYLQKELSANDYRYLWNGKTIYNYLKTVPNTKQGAYDAAYYWCYYFEVPANKEQVAKDRGNLATSKYWPEWGNASVSVLYNAEAALKVLQYAAGAGTLTTTEKKNYDMNSDNILNATDALRILEKAAGI